MTYILIPALIILMGLVVVSLFRGLNAFRQSMDDTAQEPGTGATELQIRQNKMMWARVKYQMGAIIVVCILMLMNR
ncbi:MAG: HIG1 domain-containing protein [Novosphingobium sp.]|nr:HIG1 domain-containing protein [Novosphingobium sp.]